MSAAAYAGVSSDIEWMAEAIRDVEDMFDNRLRFAYLALDGK